MMEQNPPLCVFVTLEDSTGHEIDDHLCEPVFRQRGWRLESWAWTVEHPWHQADLIVLRSCYDYWLRPEPFNEFLMSLESQELSILNPPRLVRWNSSKRYLIHLGGMGVPVVPSLILDTHTLPEDLPGFLAAHPGVSEFVVKPLIGSGGFEMERLPRERLVRENFSKEVIVQPFLAEIHQGEWSAIFLNGEPSHAVVKQATAGEYRVQDSHGGTTRGITWEDQPTLRDHALRVAEALKTLALPLPCYARYDFVAGKTEGELLLMEVEVIEPTLFLTHDQGAPQRFVDALLAYPPATR
jgi:glutathione synthase/RimK-type ligase-like ATP-grasp enzyme